MTDNYKKTKDETKVILESITKILSNGFLEHELIPITSNSMFKLGTCTCHKSSLIFIYQTCGKYTIMKMKRNYQSLKGYDKIMEEHKEENAEIVYGNILRDDYDYIADVTTIARIYGYDEGVEEGIKQGREEGKLDVAKEMQKQGFAVKDIANILKEPYDKIDAWLP